MPGVAGTITNITGLVNAHELSVVEYKTLKMLMHNSIGTMFNALPENPNMVGAGGTFIFRKQKTIQTEIYTSANRGQAGDLPASEIITVSKKGERVAKYEIETLDLQGLAFGSREQFLSYVSAGLSNNLSANMDAYKLRAFITDAKAREAKYIATHSGKTIKDLANDPTQDDWKRFVWNDDWNDIAKGATDILQAKFKYWQVYMQLSQKFVALTTELDRYNLGSSPRDYYGYGNQHVFNQIAGADTTSLLSNQLLDGMAGISGYFPFLGVPMVSHAFFGQDINKTTSFNKDEDFKFAGVYGVIAHGESAFVAAQELQFTTSIIPQSGNQIYVVKYNLFEALIRPLYIMLVGKTLQ